MKSLALLISLCWDLAAGHPRVPESSHYSSVPRQHSSVPTPHKMWHHCHECSTSNFSAAFLYIIDPPHPCLTSSAHRVTPLHDCKSLVALGFSSRPPSPPTFLPSPLLSSVTSPHLPSFHLLHIAALSVRAPWDRLGLSQHWRRRAMAKQLFFTSPSHPSVPLHAAASCLISSHLLCISSIMKISTGHMPDNVGGGREET